ncbi:WD40 repeat domain-containing protein [Aquisphaera insulae]|uniref:WD40 repeat domain-containing protein n=1 Tax=Aquisphaera insulae TaxID=2712864 RepID=UPI0013EC277A|nr:WD40 repeat domain-containing protein [Aquisphaera insulae]
MKTRVALAGWMLATAMLATVATRARADGPKRTRPPQVWAVIVGVSKYTDPAIPEGESAYRQSARVLKWFREAGWDEEHQLLLQDFGTRDPGSVDHPSAIILPTRKNLDWAIEKWLDKRAAAGDLVVLYFAGQAGSVVSRPTPRSEPIVEHFLLPNDAVKASLNTTGWSLDRVVDRCALKKIRVVCFLGTGVGVDPGQAQAPADPRQPGEAAGKAWLRRLTRWPGVQVWLASDRPMGFGRAVEPSVAFTDALLKGLGDPSTRPNLAEALQQLRQDARLSNQGFQSAGAVPADVNLWQVEFGKVAKPPRPEMLLQTGHADRITALACAGDQGMVFSASMDSTVRAWSLADGSLLNVWTGMSVGATALGLGRGDRRLAMAGGRGSLHVAELPSFQVVDPARPPHDRRVEVLAMLPDGESVITIDRDANAILTKLTTSPLATTPWPAEGVRVRDVACGGGGTAPGVVAALLEDGSIRLFDAQGGEGRPLEKEGKPPLAIAVDPAGKVLATGDADGRIVLIEVAKRSRSEVATGAAARRIRLASTGWLTVGHDAGLRAIAPPAADGSRRVIDLRDRPAACTSFSSNGRYLAACDAGTGALHVWRLDGADAPRVVLSDPLAGAASVALSGEGDLLVVGGLTGRVAAREIEPANRGVAPRGWTVERSTGKVTQVSTSGSRRSLLLVSGAGWATLWDLKERTSRRLPGSWKSGAMLSDDEMVLAAGPGERSTAGKLVRVRRDRERSRFLTDPAAFSRTRGSFTIPPRVLLEGIVVSPDAKRIAATANPAQRPLVCVWDARSGELTHWITGLQDAAVSLDFSADGLHLATAGNSSAARLWDLTEPGERKTPEVVFEDPNAGSASVTAVAIRPGSRQLVTGRQDGQVDLWSWEAGRARLEVPRLVELYFSGKVHALAFTEKGTRLAAAGDGNSIWLGTLEGAPRAVDDLNALRPHHFEQINDLIAWPDTSILISASDDTTVRFWDLKQKSLWGTFTASVPGPDETGKDLPRVEWVFYTPDGFFDASTSGQKLVHFRRGARADAMERYEETLYRFGLGESLLVGQAPRPNPLEEAPPISILEPARPDPSIERTTLRVTLGDANWSELALYHNDRPIPTGLDPARRPFPSEFRVDVRLVKGENRFSVMASRDGSYASISDPIKVVYDGPMEPGRVHVVALGVGAYSKRQLKYAKPDARSLADVLQKRGKDGKGTMGVRAYLPDAEVNETTIEDAFDQIRKVVAERPQDKVVVFLAGHTGVFDDRFCLLLPRYPFPDDAPELVAMRGDAPRPASGAAPDPDSVLPYAFLALNLGRLNALDRLVIVDACQAQSILNDPQVLQIQKWSEIQNRKTRTSYLLAARRNEPALEVDPLGHGLFTYTLLRGLGELDTADDPDEIRKLNLPADADRDGDQVLTTAELIAFVDDHLREISGVFPEIVATREARVSGGRPRTSRDRLVQNPLLQTFGSPFALVPVNRPNASRAGEDAR